VLLGRPKFRGKPGMPCLDKRTIQVSGWALISDFRLSISFSQQPRQLIRVASVGLRIEEMLTRL
jgi:hypothetical protein